MLRVIWTHFYLSFISSIHFQWLFLILKWNLCPTYAYLDELITIMKNKFKICIVYFFYFGDSVLIFWIPYENILYWIDSCYAIYRPYYQITRYFLRKIETFLKPCTLFSPRTFFLPIKVIRIEFFVHTYFCNSYFFLIIRYPSLPGSCISLLYFTIFV